ncbi:MAG: hypothetical protein IKU29_03985 [Parabacteroides sp.]|nr:hypothetical protein [Parabacteroides sp.]
MINDKDKIRKIIDMREDDEIVIPLYVQINGKRYEILEMNKINVRFNPYTFNVGFGTSDSLFIKNSFPVNRINEFKLIEGFNIQDEDTLANIRYTIFESGYIDNVKDDDVLGNNINKYFECLYDKCKEYSDNYFKELISGNVSLSMNSLNKPKNDIEDIPVEKEKDNDILYATEDENSENDEEVPIQFGIKEYTGELSKYSSSWDPKFFNEDDEEDHLDELIKEVEEYSYDEDNNDYSTDFDIF